jgi:hypothetical protein
MSDRILPLSCERWCVGNGAPTISLRGRAETGGTGSVAKYEASSRARLFN